MAFEANRGQTDRSVGFLARGSGYTLFLKPDEAVFALSKKQGGKATDAGPDRATPDTAGRRSERSAHSTISSVLRMQLVGASHAAASAGADELGGKANYFIGSDPAKWQTNVSTYGRVHYAGVYKGVDVEYYGNQRQLEYDFRVAPGADYRQISLKFAGADSVKVEPETGDLLIGVDGQTVRQHKPVVYQESEGERREIEGRFTITHDSRVAFEIEEYDATKPLVIDPVLVYSTYLGGSNDETAYAIAADAAGNAYVTGDTTSTDFPLANPIQGTKGGGFDDAFITKINAAGSAVVYSTYLGGSDGDYGLGIATDQSGNAYVQGRKIRFQPISDPEPYPAYPCFGSRL